MLLVERYRPAPTVLDADRTPLSRALGIGACQVLALVPGVSRSGATIVGGMLMGLDRAAAAEFSFFLAMPTMMAAFAHSLLKVRHQLGSERAMEIAVGLHHGVHRVSARRPTLPRGRPTNRFCALRLVSHRARPGAVRSDSGALVVIPPMQWLRRSFITGFFVTVPLVISVAAFVWIFRLIDGFVGPFYDAWLQRMPQLGITHAPGLGILTTALFVLLVGAVATNVLGKRLLQTTEGYLLRVPVFRTDLCAGQAAGRRVLSR